jgi:hypothetical protein
VKGMMFVSSSLLQRPAISHLVLAATDVVSLGILYPVEEIAEALFVHLADSLHRIRPPDRFLLFPSQRPTSN